MCRLPIPTPEEVRSAVRGKVVIVTGAASGIGYATAQMFASSGAQVIIVDRDEDLGSQAAEKIGYGAIFSKCDVTSWEDQRQLFSNSYLKYGSIDVVVCNAGIDPEIILASNPKDEKVHEARNQVRFNYLADEVEPQTNGGLKCPPNTIMDVNVTGVIYGVKLSVHYMRKSGGGRIVVIGSAAAYIPVPEQSIYCASKHAVLGLVRATSQRGECKENNIAISMVAPWLTVTPLTSMLESNLTRHVPVSSGADVSIAVAINVIRPWEHVNGKSIWVQGQTYTEVEEVITSCHSSLILK
ncbi:hypothetical protein BGZ60DRAFT_367298 [Tricladium varicosporioides]|nr:hypothetical protein BGZ60DRAFT_367298 [Hymenoscyphus varicosporioides]